jgi:anti-anti-sigma factor
LRETPIRDRNAISLPGMTFEFPYDDDIVVISVVGRVPREQIGEVEKTFLGLIKQGCRRFLADCSRAEHLSSTGVGLLMYHLKTIGDVGGRLVIVNLPASTRRSLEPMRLETFLTVCETREQALGILRGSAPRAPHPGRRAFTLVELLVVIAIIGLLMSLLTGGMIALKRRSQVMQTRTLLTAVQAGCETFRANHGRYPWPEAGSVGPTTVIDPAAVYTELRGQPGSSVNRTRDYLPGLAGTFVKTVAGKGRLQDAWGSDLSFRADPQSLNPVIWSRGPDRVDDTNFEDPPGAYTSYAPPPAPAAYSDPAKFPRTYYYLGDGRSRRDDISNL